MTAVMIPSSPEQIDTLTRINLQDMFDNLGLSSLRFGRGLIARAMWLPAQRLAHQVAWFDRRVGEIGLRHGARELLMQLVSGLDVSGIENVPVHGGVVIAVNHPGLTDSLACFTSIPRDDLRVVSADRPFLRALPNVAQKMFWVSEQPSARLTVVREIARYLRAGGAVMICPAGQIEPDPAVMPGASELLCNWSDSLGMFARLAPESVIVPMVVSGVVYPPALHNPLTRLRQHRKERERVAATIQAALMSSGLIRQQLRVKVEFGKALRARDLNALGDAAAITRGVTDAVRLIMVRHQPSRQAIYNHPSLRNLNRFNNPEV